MRVQKLTFITRIGLIGGCGVCRLVVVAVVEAAIACYVQRQRLRVLVLPRLASGLALLL